MNSIIMLLPLIFSFMSSALVAWGTVLIYKLVTIKCEYNTQLRMVRIYIGLIGTTSLGILSLLFIFTDFAAFHMGTIILLEIWYVVFLCAAEEFPENPCQITFDQKTNTFITHID